MDGIIFSPSTGILTITLGRALSPEEAASFALELEGAVTAALAREPRLRILFDATRVPVQPLASFSPLARLKDVFPAPPMTAIVLGSNLAKLQANRGVTSSSVRTFLAMAEARAWLDTADAGPGGDRRADIRR